MGAPREKYCGTCRHFRAIIEDGEDGTFGDCLWAGPVPVWVSDAERHDGMMADDGRDCAAWGGKS